jgi:class 3 adenylate cyclase
MYSHAADFESRQIERQSGEMVEAQHASRMLLKNLLPSNIVDQINQGRGLIADYFDDVTVLFTDMKGFTAFSSTITPQRLVEFLNEMYVLKYAGNPGLGILPF